jgi:hypothetical protein
VQMPFIETEEAVLQPWKINRYRLIGWYEMLQFSAIQFFWCGVTLRGIRSDCYFGSIPEELGETPLFNLAHDLDDKAIERAQKQLKHVEESFREIGLRISADTVKEVTDALGNRKPRHNFQWLADHAREIEKLAAKEIKGNAFFYIPAEHIKFFTTQNKPYLFGDAVGNAFPSATFDISEAGVCLALARGTGSVFHLMRVLEIGLNVLGAKFGVSLAHTNWAPAIEEIESKIRNMHKESAWKALPDCKQQQEFYAQAASHFGVVKDAWRNYTMHARGFYTEEQAERMFENVKGFMQKLAERLSENETSD